jgi:hypothetical protein
MGDIEFAPLETYAFADTIFQLTRNGFINAVSVGFNPLEWTFVNDKDRPYGIDFKRQELVEISICPVPCNANALIEARAKGIDTRPMVHWAEKILDEGGRILIPKSELEALRSSAAEKPSVRYYITGGKNLSPAAVIEVKERVDAWLTDKEEGSLFLGEGLELKTLGSEAMPGNCGRAAAIECGMLNPLECAVHTVAEGVKAVDATKAGRRISAANIDHLTKCMDHIKAVIDSNDPEDPAAGELVGDDHVVDPPAAVAAAPATTTRDAAKATLAAARAAQAGDLTH